MKKIPKPDSPEYDAFIRKLAAMPMRDACVELGLPPELGDETERLLDEQECKWRKAMDEAVDKYGVKEQTGDRKPQTDREKKTRQPTTK